MNVYERIQVLRKEHLKMTQEVFASRIKISRANLGSIEVGRINVTDRVISDICSEFSVSQDWLRTGEGEMFIESDDTNIASVAAEFNLDELSQIILKAYVKMDPTKRVAFNHFVSEIADTVMGERIEKARLGVNHIISDSEASEAVKMDLTGKAGDDQELAALHAMLDEEFAKEKKAASKASFAKESDAG